jgi:hypothetical protein
MNVRNTSHYPTFRLHFSLPSCFPTKKKPPHTFRFSLVLATQPASLCSFQWLRNGGKKGTCNSILYNIHFIITHGFPREDFAFIPFLAYYFRHRLFLCYKIYSTASIIRTNWDRRSSVNQIVWIIKHAWEYYLQIL